MLTEDIPSVSTELKGQLWRQFDVCFSTDSVRSKIFTHYDNPFDDSLLIAII